MKRTPLKRKSAKPRRILCVCGHPASAHLPGGIDGSGHCEACLVERGGICAPGDLSHRHKFRARRATTGRVKQTCSIRGCRRTPKAEGLCLTHAKMECDRLYSAIIRNSGPCVRCGTFGNLQCSHIVSRRYLATRWLIEAAEPACASCHHWQHMHPLENEVELYKRLGYDFDLLKEKALRGGRPDYVAILADLRGRICATPLS